MENNELLKNGKSLLIGELIRQVQRELVESQRQREEEGELSLFEVESLVIEAHFVVTDSLKPKGEFDLKILTLGGEATYAREQVHKITLTLKTVPSEDEDLGLDGLDVEPTGRRPRRA